MTISSFSKIFIVGGTGAQGLPIVRSLVQDGKYQCRILTRDATSKRSQSLAALGRNVELFEGSFMSETDLRNGYHGCDAAFVNIDGFNTGEKGEMYWAIRSYELAVEDGGIRFFVYGNLDFVYKKSGYNPGFRTGHYDGKGRIGEWIISQGAEAAKKGENTHTGVALFTTGPYIEMITAPKTPMTPVIKKMPSEMKCSLGKYHYQSMAQSLMWRWMTAGHMYDGCSTTLVVQTGWIWKLPSNMSTILTLQTRSRT